MRRAWRALAVLSVAAGMSTGAVSPAGASSAAAARPPAAKTPIRHFVTLMQEDHSFDSYFGTYPGADGIPAGVCMPVRVGVPADGCVKPFAIGERPLGDLGHTQALFDAQYNAGQMNGFVAALSKGGVTNDLTMGHYARRDIPYAWNLVRRNVLFDRFFSSAAGGNVSNHMYWITGGPGALVGDAIPAEGWGATPTIFDRLEAAGVSWKFYVENYDPSITFRRGREGKRGLQLVRVPLLGYARYVDDPKLFGHIAPISEYFEDLRRGTLPAVSYVVSSGSSERPPASVRSGQRFVRSVVDGLTASSAWPTSAIVVSYANWGGWYDHVVPPQVDQFGYGFRVPAFLVSPYAKVGVVDHAVLDFTSILRFVEDNWGLAPLAARDGAALGLASAFDFAAAPRPAAFVSAGRPAASVVHSPAGVVYASYVLAVLLVIALLAYAIRRGGRRGAKAVPT